MSTSFAWKIGGDQGEGIDSTGDVVGTVASRLGYHIFGYKHFSSRIKGGHTHYTVRFGTRPLYAPEPLVHVLVALTQETIDRNAAGLAPGGPLLADTAIKPHLPDGSDANLVEIPMTQIAKDLGAAVVRNMVAVGASAAVLGLPLAAFEAYAEEKFGRKGAETVGQNIAALQRGHRFIEEETDLKGSVALPAVQPAERLVLTGNTAVALGAVAAGCRLMSAYPITPATDIMESLASLLPRFGGAVCQMEDELAAITLAVGAGYAGARAMTSTSGPGLSLMQEAIGLASSAEIPVVVVDVQRAGPSTGMPTKTEQSDLMAAIFGGHGEGERIVIAPATATEAFEDGQAVFSLAERYQCPVILLSDLALGQFEQTVEPFKLGTVAVDRGKILSADDIAQMAGEYERHHVTEDGISPRALPGTPKGQFLATGVEHNPIGKVSEDPANRAAQVLKRRRKLEPLRTSPTAMRAEGTSGADIVLVGFGSTMGSIWEAAETLAESAKVGWIQVHQMWPLPTEQLREALADARAVLVIEQNSTGELLRLFKMEDLEDERMHSLLQYNGVPLLPQQIAEAAQKLLVREEV